MNPIFPLSLTRQLIALLITVVCLTAFFSAVTSYVLLENSLEAQIEARLELGSQHTETLWQVMDLQNRQTLELLAQRPTLERLLESPQSTELNAYLATFQENTVLDFLYLVDVEEDFLAGQLPDNSLESYQWEQPSSDFKIVAGIYLDEALLESLGQDSEFIYEYPTMRPVPEDYRALSIPLGREFDVVMLLSIADILASQRFGLLLIVGITLLTAALASIFGGFFIRRRIHPLWQLKDAAKRMGKGDLSTPIIAVEDLTPDISTLRDALENSRQVISSSLQEIQQQRDWVNALMQSIVEGIVSYKKGQIVFHSESTAQIMQWRKNKIGRELDKVFVCQDEDSLFSEVLPLEGRAKAIDLLLENGRGITLLVTRARSLPSGETSLVLRDITEESRKQSAQAYYLAHMSHEFRTPLSGMKASLELLLENLGNLSKPEESQLLNSIVLSVSNLQSLIDNLLEGSKLEANQFSLRRQRISLDAILIDALRTMQPLLSRRQQSLELAERENSPLIWADKTRMVQVMVNLLSNASKYSPIGTSIEILVELRENRLWLGVADRGAGVPEAEREAIFNQFVRLESSAETDHSTGLGLAVVRGIIEAHGGTVGVNGREGGGSIFWFELGMEDESTRG
jgi:signal transduction histidine kinase